jgi:hypothetical protein
MGEGNPNDPGQRKDVRMVTRKTATLCVLGLMVGLAGWGCASSHRRSTGLTRPAVPPLTASAPTAVPNATASTPPPGPSPFPDTPAPAAQAAAPSGSAAPPRPQQPDGLLAASASQAESTRPITLDSTARLRELHRLAAERYAGIESYTVRMKRREQVNGRDKPEELLLFKFRKQPFSVYFKWLGPEGQGREVVYVRGQYEDKIHTLLAAGDMPFMPAGKHIALAPDSPFVRSASRHAITEAGIGSMIDNFGRLVFAQEKGDTRAGSLTYLGRVQRPEYDSPMEAVEQAIPAGADSQLPKGAKRLWLFDPASGLPVLVSTVDAGRHEVEYYCYDRTISPAKLDDRDFDPNKLWSARR